MDNQQMIMNNTEPEHSTEQEVDLMEYLRIFLKYKWIILFCLLCVSGISYIYTRRADRIYQASAAILLDTTKQSDLFFSTPGPRTSINNTIEIIRSKPVLQMTYDLVQRDPEYNSLPIATSGDPIRYLRRIQTVNKRDTDILTISFESTSPLEASLIPNYVAQALIDQITLHERAELNSIKDFLEGQVEIVSSRLRISEEDLRMYKIERGVFMLSSETQSLIDRLSTVEAAYEDALTDQKITQQKIEYLQNELERQDSLFTNINAVISTSILERLRAEVVSIQSRITNLITINEYPPDHPEIIQLNRQLDNAKTNLNNELQRVIAVQSGSADPISYRGSLVEKISLALIDLNVAESKVNALGKTLDEYNLEMTLLPDKEIELARLERNYRLNEKIHTLLVEKYEDAKIAVQAKLANIRLLEESTLPGRPIKPNKRMNYLIGLIIGLGLGLGSTLIIHALDTKIHTLDDMKKSINLPIFGTIPQIRLSESDQISIVNELRKAQGDEKNELLETQSLIEARLVSHYDPKSPVTESYRTLRTNIIARKKPNQPMVLCLTSAAPKEGKTTSVANLGITIAQTEARVILVDMDLRRPMLSKLFGIAKETGVADYLIDYDMKIEQIIKHSKIPNLDIITSGFIPPNPSEIISSKRTDTFIEELRKRYDFILIDAPPVIAVTDALILTKKVDMMLLVVKIDYTERDIVKRSRELLANVGSDFTGAIANGIEPHRYYRGYSYYYYFYSNYYYYDEKKSNPEANKDHISKFLRKN
jgi:tyrosine-protein kinase Etk/Wzc